MAESYKKVFSKFEIKEIAIKFLDKESATSEAIKCTGSFEEQMDVKEITKKCNGIVIKRIIKATGTGENKWTGHVPYYIYQNMFGVISDGYKDGITSYGNKSVHHPFGLFAVVADEDDNEMFVAYPNCVITAGQATKIENGAEEVAEIELTIGIMPDENGQGKYEALASSLDQTVTKEKWLNEFNTELIKLSI